MAAPSNLRFPAAPREAEYGIFHAWVIPPVVVATGFCYPEPLIIPHDNLPASVAHGDPEEQEFLNLGSRRIGGDLVSYEGVCQFLGHKMIGLLKGCSPR